MEMDILVTVILAIFTMVVTVGLFIVRGIREDMRLMTKDIHDFMLRSERRLTMLETHVFGVKHGGDQDGS